MVWRKNASPWRLPAASFAEISPNESRPNISSSETPAWPAALPGQRDGECPLRVIGCRDRPDSWCPLYFRKLPRQTLTGVSVKGHKRTSGQPRRGLRSTSQTLVLGCVIVPNNPVRATPVGGSDGDNHCKAEICCRTRRCGGRMAARRTCAAGGKVAAYRSTRCGRGGLGSVDGVFCGTPAGTQLG